DVMKRLRAQSIALIGMGERLMLRLVCDDLRGNRRHAGRGYIRIAEMESDRLTRLQNFPLKPLQAQGMSIWGETKPRGEQVVDCSFPFGDETGIEEQFHRRYLKVMCQVVDMN